MARCKLVQMDKQMSHFEQVTVWMEIQRVNQLLACGIFTGPHLTHALCRGAFVECLIALRDLIGKANKYATPIAFTDDVTVDGDVTDVGSLIKYVRDALCHPDSPNHLVDDLTKATFNAFAGKGFAVRSEGNFKGAFQQENPYADDVAFFFGGQRVFLRRHLVRVLQEAETTLTPLLKFMSI